MSASSSHSSTTRRLWLALYLHGANQATTREVVAEVMAPYLKAARWTLGLQQTHKAVLLIDCWEVHRSAEFQNYLMRHYSDVITLFLLDAHLNFR